MIPKASSYKSRVSSHTEPHSILGFGQLIFRTRAHHFTSVPINYLVSPISSLALQTFRESLAHILSPSSLILPLNFETFARPIQDKKIREISASPCLKLRARCLTRVLIHSSHKLYEIGTDVYTIIPTLQTRKAWWKLHHLPNIIHLPNSQARIST